MDPIVGNGRYTYKVDENWQRAPQWLEVKACAVSVDSEDRVYCFNRNDAHPVVIFDREGNFLSSWGEGLFRFPHAIRIVRKTGPAAACRSAGPLRHSTNSTPAARLRRTTAERAAAPDPGWRP